METVESAGRKELLMNFPFLCTTHFTVLYCTVLYCTVLHCNVMYR